MAVYTVLPISGEQDAPAASGILRQIISEPANVVMVLIGRPSKIEKIIETCVGRAEAYPGTRRVVHAPDPDVLEPEQLESLRGRRRNIVAAVVGYDDKVKKRLNEGEAWDSFEVESAFAAAE